MFFETLTSFSFFYAFSAILLIALLVFNNRLLKVEDKLLLQLKRIFRSKKKNKKEKLHRLNEVKEQVEQIA